MKTFIAKDETVQRKWVLIDAQGMVLGRLAVRVADILRGKCKEIFTPHVDCGDYVIVVNADKIRVTGRKEDQKEYIRFSGYPGGQKVLPYRRVKAEHPERIILHAVEGMLPGNRLGRAVFKKLKVYCGPNHPHEAQMPEKLAV